MIYYSKIQDGPVPSTVFGDTMNNLLKQVTEPLPHTTKGFLNQPSIYDRCQCGEWKKTQSKQCRKCFAWINHPPKIANEIIVEGEPCRQIPLTQGQYAIVDADLYNHLMRWAWHAMWDIRTQTYYARRIFFVDRRRILVAIEHVVLGYLPEKKDEKIIDHRNGNTLDDRRSNLRLASTTENGYNRKLLQRNNSSGYRGVCRDNQKGKWKSCIRVNTKLISLGNFDDPIEAAKARDAAALLYHGEFARLNFPQDRE
jgi:hypothetical protein